MPWEAWFTCAVVGMVFGLLVFTRLSPDLVMMAGLTLLLVFGVVGPDEALAGFSNEGMIAVGALFIVSAGVRETGAVYWIADRLLGQPKSLRTALARLLLPTTAISGFMNNTPLVAMLIPAVADWAKKYRIPTSQLMIPLSYAAILGGTCTLIGTSTNLVVAGLVRDAGMPSLGMFDITWVGLPCALIGVSFIMALSGRVLPDRRPAIAELEDPREYTIEMLVAPDSPLAGKTIEQAGLRHLQGVFLAEIDRAGFILPAVSPQEQLRAGDRLLFVGVVESIVDIQKIRGLVPATDQVFKLSSPRQARCLIEAVVSNSCPVAGRTIRDGRFRSVYNAAVVAVARNGERVRKKIGDIVLRPGDTLLLEAHPSFVDQQRNSRDFFLVSRLENSSPPRHERALLAVSIMGMMVLCVAQNWLGLLPASFLAAGAMIFTRCCSVAQARRSIDFQVLLSIAAAFGLGAALETSGVASALSTNLIGMAGGHPWITLAVVYAVTLVATELITNVAAAALIFPLAMATASNLQVSPMPFIIVIMMAASAGFATPIGYQTNLMVYGPGGYRFADYLRLGVPLDILVGIIAVLLTPWLFPF